MIRFFSIFGDFLFLSQVAHFTEALKSLSPRKKSSLQVSVLHRTGEAGMITKLLRVGTDLVTIISRTLSVWKKFNQSGVTVASVRENGACWEVRITHHELKRNWRLQAR